MAFFKVSCPVCQLIFPYLERLSAGSGLQVIGISQDDAADTQAFMRRFGLTLPMLLDRSEDGYRASNAYGISSVPSLFLVEQDGRISKEVAGFSKLGSGGVRRAHGRRDVPIRRSGAGMESRLRIQKLGPVRDLR